MHEEDKYEEIKRCIKEQEVTVPDRLEARIRHCVEESNIKKSTFKMRYVASIVACMMIVFALLVHYNKSFADTMAKIPVVKEVVKIFYQDSGYKEATINGYKPMDPFTWSQDGYNLKVFNIYVDEERMTYKYVITGDQVCPEDVYILTPNILLDSYKIDSSFSIEGATSVNIELVIREDFNNIIKEGVMPLSLTIGKERSKPDHSFAINMPIDKNNILYSKKYSLRESQSISINEDEILMNELSISPTSMKLTVNLANTKLYNVSFVNPYIRDDSGNRYDLINDNKCGRSNKTLLFIPSVYYKDIPDKLYFGYDGVEIMNKEGREFQLRLDEQYPKYIDYTGVQYKVHYLKYDNVLGIKITGNMSEKRLSVVPDEWTQSNGLSETGVTFDSDKRDVYNFEFLSGYYPINERNEIELRLGSDQNE